MSPLTPVRAGGKQNAAVSHEVAQPLGGCGRQHVQGGGEYKLVSSDVVIWRDDLDGHIFAMQGGIERREMRGIAEGCVGLHLKGKAAVIGQDQRHTRVWVRPEDVLADTRDLGSHSLHFLVAPAERRIVIENAVGNETERLCQIKIIDLVVSAAHHIVRYELARADLPDYIDLQILVIHIRVRGESEMVQVQTRVRATDDRFWHRNFVPVGVFLAPEGGTPALVHVRSRWPGWFGQ